MSSEALAWAFKQNVKPSGAKFTLIALCECANYKTGRILPSITHLCEITGQNRKSIIAHVAQLEAQGYITDTGERAGQTKQIKVYQASLGTVPKTEQSQKRNSPKNDRKQSQKRDTEPSLEPSLPTEPKGSSGSTRAGKGHRLPDDWKPEPLAGDLAADVQAWPAGTIERELAKFRDWAKSAPGQKGVKLDWQATWRNWIRRRIEEGPKQNDRKPPANDEPANPYVRATLARQAERAAGIRGQPDHWP